MDFLIDQGLHELGRGYGLCDTLRAPFGPSSRLNTSAYGVIPSSAATIRLVKRRRSQTSRTVGVNWSFELRLLTHYSWMRGQRSFRDEAIQPGDLPGRFEVRCAATETLID
jgi:hypothetical protein